MLLWLRRRIAKGLIEEYYLMKVRKYEKHLPWLSFWNKSASEDALSVTSRKAANVPSDAYHLPEGIQILEMRVRGSTADRTGVLHVYACRKGDDISRIGSMAMIVGDQAATLNNALYIHSMIPTDRWITEINLADEKANDGMSRIAFDVTGYDEVFCHITYTGDTEWWIDISGFTN